MTNLDWRYVDISEETAKYLINTYNLEEESYTTADPEDGPSMHDEVVYVYSGKYEGDRIQIDLVSSQYGTGWTATLWDKKQSLEINNLF
jgi:hypothetical protein